MSFQPKHKHKRFYPHECILNKTLNSSQRAVPFSKASIFFAPLRCNLFVKQKDERHEKNRHDFAISVWSSQLSTRLSRSNFFTPPLKRIKRILIFIPALSPFMRAASLFLWHFGLWMKMKKSKKVETVWELFGKIVKLLQMKQQFYCRSNNQIFSKRRNINLLTQQQWRIM